MYMYVCMNVPPKVHTYIHEASHVPSGTCIVKSNKKEKDLLSWPHDMVKIKKKTDKKINLYFKINNTYAYTN